MNKRPSKTGLASRLRSRGLNKDNLFLILTKYGKLGVKALEEATPKDTGKTASNWSFTVSKDLTLSFKNSELTSYGVPIPILHMYGYTRGTKYVAGDDYVRRALDPVIQSLKNEIRKELL